MVCAKCQKLVKTKLVTPDVKKKGEMSYASPSSSSSKGVKGSGPTLGNSGVSKVSKTCILCTC